MNPPASEQPSSKTAPSFAEIAVALILGPNPIRNLISTVLFVTIAAVFINRAIQTRFFGVFTIVTYPYYHELVTDIVREPAFVRRIGAPIVVTDAAVWCPSIRIDATTSASECHIPVRGSRASGDVLEQAQFSNGQLRGALTLSAGTTEDHAIISP